MTSRAGDDAIDRGERQDREADARARLGGAVDIAAVEQRAQPAGGASRLRGGVSAGGVRQRQLARPSSSSLAPAAPARCRSTGFRSSIIGGDRDRSVGGCTIVGGRSGSRSSASILRRLGRPQRQMPPRQPLDAGRIFERRPFGAQRRDGVALAPHVAAHLGDALGAQRRLELDLVDVGRGERPAAPGRRG